MRNRNKDRHSISRITRSAVLLAAALPALLLPSGCERENLLKELAGEEAVMRFSVSESVPELLTKSQAAQSADHSETTEENVIVLTSADGRTIRLIAEEEPLTASTSSASAEASASAQGPATKAAAVYGSGDATPLGGASIGVWAYNYQTNAQPNTWQLDWANDGSTERPARPIEATYIQTKGVFAPSSDIPYGKAIINPVNWYARFFAVAPYGALGAGADNPDIRLNNAPTMQYTVPSSVDNQWDLLASRSASREITKTDPVELKFAHVLTGIRFKRDKDLSISSITVSEVYNRATLALNKIPEDANLETYTSVDGTSTSDASKDLWSNRTKSVTAPATDPSWTMDMTEVSPGDVWTNGNPKDAKKETQYDYAAKDANILMMIPQLTPQGAKISVTINGEPYTGDISGHRWLPGRLVTYRIDKQPTDFLFSVSNTKKVYFSQGNLQYEWGPGDAAIAATVAAGNQPTTDVTGKWYFAANEWEALRSANQAALVAMRAGNASAGMRIDLFSWGTSGKNYGAKKYWPWIEWEMGNQSDYGPAEVNGYRVLKGSADWGTNEIQNGKIKNGAEDQRFGWRTLSSLPDGNEWLYLVNNRNNASVLRGLGTIVEENGSTEVTTGLILLPDDWVVKDLDPRRNLSLDSSEGSFVPAAGALTASASDNIYKKSDWSAMQEAGAVFLPVTGVKEETYQELTSDVISLATWPVDGLYTTSVVLASDNALRPYSFTNSSLTLSWPFNSYSDLSIGVANRLVLDSDYAAPTYTVTLPASLEVAVGGTETLTATVKDGYGNIVPASVSWNTTSLTAAKATFARGLGATGSVTGVAAGSAGTITASINIGGVTATSNACSVTVVVPFFSVSPTKKVIFAPGNVQFTATLNADGSYTNPEWKFAANQWEYIPGNFMDYMVTPGTSKSVTYDLFGWATTGASPYDAEHTRNQPWAWQTDEGYGPSAYTADTWGPSLPQYNVNPSPTQNYQNTWNAEAGLRKACDWGIHFKPDGRGSHDYTDGDWFTLSAAEWYYLMTRGSSQLVATASLYVNGKAVFGKVLLPDNWSGCPEGCQFTHGHNPTGTEVPKNRYYVDGDATNGPDGSWAAMEAKGAVFLPAAGIREDGMVAKYQGDDGGYWTSSSGYSDGDGYKRAVYISFGMNYLGTVTVERRFVGCSVRLVREVQ